MPGSRDSVTGAEAAKRQHKHHICMVVTSSLGLRSFLLPHIRVMSGQYRLTVLAGDDQHAGQADLPQGVAFRLVPIRREIRPVADLFALLRLFRIFRREQFDLVYTVSPKAGLLGMISAWLARVPRRIHCFTGQTWVTQTGLMRKLLKGLDRLLGGFSTRVLADSPSQRNFLVDQGVVPADKIEVLGSGSMAGVDTRRFMPNPDARRRIRTQLGIPEKDYCLLYVGRLKHDKGVPDLVEAFARIRVQREDVHLMLVGPDEEGLLPGIISDPGLHHVGYTPKVAEYMAAADIFCLPSYREGFGQVVVEAGAVGLPIVASHIYGITDAVEPERTGLLHQPGDIKELEGCLRRLLEDSTLRQRLSQACLVQAQTRFSQSAVTDAFARFIQGQF